MGDGALASLPARVSSLGGDGWRLRPMNPPDCGGQRAAAKAFTGDLPSLGFFRPLSQSGSCQAVQRGP